MNTNRFRYEGSWELLPELSIYQEGEAPRAGIYRITRDGVTASFHIEWESADGKRGEVRFAGRCDGRREKIPNPPGAEACYLHVDDSTFDSSVFIADVRVAYARRRVAADGSLMSIVQESRRPDGTTFRNFQVYKRLK